MNYSYCKWFVIMGIFSATTTLYCAGFSTTDALINLPVAKAYIPSEVQFGVSAAYSGSASKTTDAIDRYDIDYKIAYAINEQNQLAITIPRSNQFHLKTVQIVYILALFLISCLEKIFSFCQLFWKQVDEHRPR